MLFNRGFNAVKNINKKHRFIEDKNGTNAEGLALC